MPFKAWAGAGRSILRFVHFVQSQTHALKEQVSANASVALLSVGAACVVTIAQPVFDIFGVRTILLGGWTYAMYTGSFLNYNRTGNGAFVIASGAILGLGAAFLWITQGGMFAPSLGTSRSSAPHCSDRPRLYSHPAIMLSYPLPHQKGRSEFSSTSSVHADIRYRSVLG